MTSMTAKRIRVIAASLAIALVGSIAPLSVPAANASVTVLCRGYDSCAKAGYSSHGYKPKRNNLYWRMVGGHNCTNYAAFLLAKKGLPNVRPWSGSGDAQAWGDFNPSITDSKPVVGAIAWWDQNVFPAGASGHVAYVEKVVSSSTILVSEDNYRGEFYWKRITKSGGAWPSGFIHFKDSRTPPKPSYDATLVSSGAWVDKAKTVALTTTAMRPGTTAWVELRYRNTGAKSWTNVEVGTSWPLARESELATDWLSATRAVRQTQKLVKPGSTATFLLPLTVPADATPSTEWLEHFALTTHGGTWMLSTDTIIDVVASDGADFDSRPLPTITGTVAEGSTLTAATDGWAPTADTFTYQWLRDGVAIDAATAPTRDLTGTDVGHRITVAVTATREGYNPSTQVSASTAVVTSMYSDRLAAGESLASGAQLVSANGRYQLLQRTDGNLMIYDRFSGIPLWASGKTSAGATTTLRADGNLVERSVNKVTIWTSGTAGKKATRAVLGGTGHLNLYTTKGTLIWSSYTSGR
jgi:surface antigen